MPNPLIRSGGSLLGAISKYLGDQVSNSAITVSMGRESETFLRTPLGTYEASSGSTMSFTMDGLWAKGTLKQRHGNTIEFSGMYSPDWRFRRSKATKIIGPNGQTVDISWGPNGVSQVVSTAGSVIRKLVFIYGTTGSNHLEHVDESVDGTVSRSVVFTHAGGNLASATDPENYSPSQTTMSGGSTIYQYQSAGGDGVNSCLSGIWDPMGRQVVWNEYDAFCRVTEQDSGIIETESYYDPEDQATKYRLSMPPISPRSLNLSPTS